MVKYIINKYQGSGKTKNEAFNKLSNDLTNTGYYISAIYTHPKYRFICIKIKRLGSYKLIWYEYDTCVVCKLKNIK